jgi:hypothetical protein
VTDLLRGRGAEVAACAAAALVIAAGLVMGPTQPAVAVPAGGPVVSQESDERDRYVATLATADRAPGWDLAPRPDPGPGGAFTAAVRAMQERGGEPVVRTERGTAVVADLRGVVPSIPLG